MKNSIAILTTLVFALSFAACASDDDSDKPSSTGKTKIGYMIDNFTIDPADPLCDIIDGNAGENVGSWFTWIDEDAAGTSISPAPEADQFCDATKKDGGAVDGGAYLSVSGKSGGHGVGIGAYFNFSGTKMDPVDFSEFDGLTFWAKGTANITVQLNMPAFMPIDLGGECPESDGNCYNYYSVNVKVDSKDWQEYSFAWSKFTQEDWGASNVKLDPKLIASFHFMFPSTNKDFAVDLDEIAFYTK
ncbi:MAG: hypothetical protein M0R76_08765 [Proteobacteria bacterium]|nr:hypothetical protein [Pseudomonadota bacterium]